MATSSSTDFELTLTSMLREAFERVGIIKIGSNPNGNQTSAGIRSLNIVTKDLQNYGPRS